MEGASVLNQVDDLIDLPPGFRFHPTDEEIITHYLTEKVMNSSFSARAIGEVDLNKCEPWDLPMKAKMGDQKEWYFFCQRDRKYPTGMRTNRATESGYWKATGKDKEIYKGKGCLVGMKKTLVFYKGRAPKGEKSNWVTHEYRLEGKFSHYNFPKGTKEEWVVCRVFHKNTGIKRSPFIGMESFGDELLNCPNSLPPLMDPPNYSNNDRPGSRFTDGEDEFKFKGTDTASSSARSSDGNYVSYFSMTSTNDQQEDHRNFLMPPNPNNYTLNTATPSNPTPAYPQIRLPNHYFPFPSFPGGSGFNGTDHQAILRALAANHGTSSDLERERRQYCKVEQLSSNVSLSQGTGLSTDMTTEISSSVNISKQDKRSNRSYDEDPWVGPISDLDCLLWN
ncbi:hypothetical protein F0562_016164 [Nyssa sinensis]|uniref:NAC domain-containing protein n=1 Tax=Nyssa sinensis TaxID=561372 RepID=A0A5J4ZNK4_9ASTE|nr:hypothetical protein F0562_016164 [Nyssa sinensis]